MWEEDDPPSEFRVIDLVTKVICGDFDLSNTDRDRFGRPGEEFESKRVQYASFDWSLKVSAL